jgi:hypothetical protein
MKLVGKNGEKPDAVAMVSLPQLADEEAFAVSDDRPLIHRKTQEVERCAE